MSKSIAACECLKPFYAIGEFYDDFEQTADEEVIKLLKMNKKRLQSKEDTQ